MKMFDSMAEVKLQVSLLYIIVKYTNSQMVNDSSCSIILLFFYNLIEWHCGHKRNFSAAAVRRDAGR